MDIEHNGILTATKLLALVSIEFMNTPELVEKRRKRIE